MMPSGTTALGGAGAEPGMMPAGTTALAGAGALVTGGASVGALPPSYTASPNMLPKNPLSFFSRIEKALNVLFLYPDLGHCLQYGRQS